MDFFRKKKKDSFALPVRFDYKYYAENIPPLVQTYNVFKSSFLTKIAENFLKEGKITKITNDDLLEGVDYNYAFWVLNHCHRIIAARCSLICSLKNAKEGEVKYIDFKVFRACPSCNKVPANKKIKMSDNVPLYPCLDCKEDDVCIFAYEYRW